jgi:plasmid stabilization system protein ParE
MKASIKAGAIAMPTFFCGKPRLDQSHDQSKDFEISINMIGAQYLQSLFGQTHAERGNLLMPRGDKGAYTDKQKRQAEHIEEGYEKRGVSEKEAEARAWATVNKESGGGKKSGSGRGKEANRSASKKGGKKGGKKAGAQKSSKKAGKKSTRKGSKK